MDFVALQFNAQMVELVDTRGLEPRAERRAGSNPVLGTNIGVVMVSTGNDWL